MGELKQITDRIGFEGLMEYLIYGVETGHTFVDDDGKDAYQKRIDAAFEELFDGLKHVFPSASRNNDTLYSVVLDFSIAHQETYTVMGFLAGLRFCTDLQKACCSIDGSKIQSAIKKAVPEPDGSVAVEMGDGSRFEIRRREDA